MSDTNTSLHDVRGIHTPIDPLAALPAQWHTPSTLYLTLPLDHTTPARRTRQDWPAPTHHDLNSSSYCHSLYHTCRV